MSPEAAVVPDETGVTATLAYSLDVGVQPTSEQYGPRNMYRKVTGVFEERMVPITNGRPLAAGFSLERNGFIFMEYRTAITDFFDDEQVARVYYPELERLVMQVSGAFRAVVYDLVVRSGDKDEREARLVREPVHVVHNDYTEKSGPQRLRELLPELIPGEGAALLGKRFAVIQVWRPIRTVWTDALAVVDAGAVRPGDLIRSERRYPDRVGEVYRVKYSAEHRWFYFPRMQPDEVIVFKTFESAADGRARFTPHAAFKDPNSPVDAPHRQSVEARLFAFFD